MNFSLFHLNTVLFILTLIMIFFLEKKVIKLLSESIEIFKTSVSPFSVVVLIVFCLFFIAYDLIKLIELTKNDFSVLLLVFWLHVNCLDMSWLSSTHLIFHEEVKGVVSVPVFLYSH